MKLSKAQTEVMNKAKADIDFARTHTLLEWGYKEKGFDQERIERLVKNHELYHMTEDEMLSDIEKTARRYAETYAESYENERNGIVLTMCNSRTLAKLEELGLIEIIYDSNGTTFGVDTIKVLNY